MSEVHPNGLEAPVGQLHQEECHNQSREPRKAEVDVEAEQEVQ